MRLKLCAKCQKPIPASNRYCDKCKAIVEQRIEEYKKESSSRYNKQRNPKYTEFYNSKAWRMLRYKYISKHFLCEECQKENKNDISLAEEVHHIDPIQTPTGWERRLEWSNLIALCHYHHDIAHKRFKGRK